MDSNSTILIQLEAENNTLKEELKAIKNKLITSQDECECLARELAMNEEKRITLPDMRGNNEPRDSEKGKGRFDNLYFRYIARDDVIAMLDLIREALKDDEKDRALDLIFDIVCNLDDDPKENDRLYYEAILECGKDAELGAEKWTAFGWQKKGLSMKHLMNSAYRHGCKHKAGWHDESYSHLGAFMWNIQALSWMIEFRPDLNDYIEEKDR